jgi:hypothetical protein
MVDNVVRLTTDTERAIATMQAKMRAAGMETAEGEPSEILRKMIQEREHREAVAKLREDQRRHDAIMRAHWRTRPWHQKLRYWVLGTLVLLFLIQWALGWPDWSSSCIEHSRWEFC